MKRFFAAVLFVILASSLAQADETAPAFEWRKPSLTVNVGLIQPILLKGANVEADFRWNHLVVSYSHGWNLSLSGDTVVGDMHTQNVSLRIPFTTGLGVGGFFYVPVLRSFFELRLEGKAHRFDASYTSAAGALTPIAQYTTFTLGGGAYWTALPFIDRHDSLRGIDISFSLRYWPNVASTLPGGSVEYQNSYTGREETHRAANIGIANTPFFINVSVGYLFQ